ncbi:MAG: protoporphyrinogen oxidase [Trueperaceae bacterium]
MTKRVAIVGGGPTGLATGVLLARNRPDLHVVVFEADDVAGGKARSVTRDGYTVDLGPNGIVTNRPATLELIDAIGLTSELQPATDAARHRYLFHEGGLQPLPTDPRSFLRSELLSCPAKARALLEPLLFRNAGEPSHAAAADDGEQRGRGTSANSVAAEESVHAFLARHFGRELADRFAQPLVVGITGGDAKRLSVDALFPQFRSMEARHGSLLRALMRQSRAAKTTAAKTTAAQPPANPPATPPPRLTGFQHGGMGRFTQALADTLSSLPNAELRLSARVATLERTVVERAGQERGASLAGATGYRLTFTDPGRHSPIEADSVVLTLPAPGAARLLDALAPAAAAELRAIPYVGMRVFGLGFHRYDVPRALDGFGFLIAPGERVRSLGVLWTSAIYPNRAPDGHVLLRVLAGGAFDPEMLELDDDAALSLVLRDLLVTMGIAAEPTFVESAVWNEAIPQYTVGHGARVAAIDRAAAALPGLHLIGNAYRGVAINDCVAEARRVVDALGPA